MGVWDRERESAQAQARSCDSCTACCHLMGIVDLPGGVKPANSRCPNQGPKGCRIYAVRPASCRQFSCEWLHDGAVRLPAEARPDKSGVVVWGPLDTDALMLTVDPARPEAWRAEAIFPALERWMTSGRRILKHCGGRDSWLTMARDGDRGAWQVTERAM
jgi:hypothetical protein